MQTYKRMSFIVVFYYIKIRVC